MWALAVGGMPVVLTARGEMLATLSHRPRHFAIVAWLVFALVELVKGHFTFLPRD